MNGAALRDRLEGGQIAIYFIAVVLGAGIAPLVPGTASWESAINITLAL